MNRMSLSLLVLAGALAGCTSPGNIVGTVTVAGGSAEGVPVVVHGKQGGAAVTGADGTFTVRNLAAGDYLVTATVADSVEGTRSALVSVSGGADSAPVTLSFRQAGPTRVSGRVVFSDGADAAGLSVTATGARTSVVTTGAGGAFTFEALPAGAWVLSVEATDTREGRASLGIDVSRDTDVGELRLTPVGRLAGTVTSGGAPVADAEVTVAGTGHGARTDAQGAFSIIGVETGARTVVARDGQRSGTAALNVARGDNPPVELTLSAAKTGTVRGVVAFAAGLRPANEIQLTVPGAQVSAAANVAGAYSLTVPVGTWSLFGAAPHYPNQKLLEFTVREGETVDLPLATLTWWRDLYTCQPCANAQGYVEVDTVYEEWRDDAPPTHGLQVVRFFESRERGSNVYRLMLLNLATNELLPLAVHDSSSGVVQAAVSPGGRYVFWRNTEKVWLFDLQTRELHLFVYDAILLYDDVLVPLAAEFASDDSALFVDHVTLLFGGESTRRHVDRIALPAATSERFPAPDAVTTRLAWLSRGRWVFNLSLADGGTSANLLTNTGWFTLLESANDSNHSIWPFVHQRLALDAGQGSQLRVLPPDGTALLDVDTPPAPAFWLENAHLPDFPVFTAIDVVGGPSTTFLVDNRTGATTPMPRFVDTLTPNATGTRAILTSWTDDESAYVAELLSLPPTAPRVEFARSPDRVNIGWLSPTRAWAGERDVGGRLFLSDDGVPVPTPDTRAGNPLMYTPGQPMVVQPVADGWLAHLDHLSVPFEARGDVGYLHTPPLTPWAPTTRAGAVSFFNGPDADVLTINAVTGTSRWVPHASIWDFSRNGTEVVGLGHDATQTDQAWSSSLFFFAEGATVTIAEPDLWSDDSLHRFGRESQHSGLLTSSGDRTRIMLGRFVP